MLFALKYTLNFIWQAFLEELLRQLRAAAEPTRLRIIALCGHAELSVGDFVAILGQSQPRVSRHLKLLVDAGLLIRNKEGSRAYYRLLESDKNAQLSQVLNDLMDESDPVLVLDLSRLGIIRSERARFADNYFDEFAGEQSQLSQISADEELINQLLLQYAQQENMGELLDIGTGTGRMLLLLGSKIEKAIGIDNSREMLAIARTKLEQADLKNCQVRIGDMYRLPFAENRFGIITINSLLRYAEKPKDVLTEATRVLKPGGFLIIVDFSDHGLTELRDEYGHRWLGFSKHEMLDMLDGDTINIESTNFFKGEALTVCVWKGQKVENG